MGKNKKTTLLVFIFVVVVSFLIRISPSNTFLKRITLTLSKFPLKVISLSFLPVRSIISCNRSLRDVSVLKKQNRKLKILLMQSKDSVVENKRLRELLSFKEKSKFTLLVARVIACDASNLKRTIVIDRGKKHGISLGDPVITPEGMVGVAAEVGSISSRVVLINDPDFSMAGKIRRSKVVGVVSGSLGGMCNLKYLDLDSDIRVGDEVISVGRNSRFPSGVPVGVVVAISKDHSGLTVFALVKPRVKLSSLEEVLVIIDK